MSSFLDKFESWFLNSARRIISLLVLILLLIGIPVLVLGVFNTFDSVSDPEISVSMLEFKDPVASKEDVEAPISSQPNNAAEEEESPWEHPLPEFESEISDMVDDLMVLGIARGRSNSIENRQMWTDYVAQQLESGRELSMSLVGADDYLVDAMVNYTNDMSDFYIDKYDINRNDLDNIDILDSADSAELRERTKQPYSDFWDALILAAEEVELEENREQAEVSINNASGLQQLLVAGSAFGAIVLLILLMLVFKAEQSLRRSADSSEVK